MRLLMVTTIALVFGATCQAGETVQLKLGDGQLAISIAGQPFATYVLQGYAKPFLLDIHAPDGTIITRPVKKGITEHPHHKGLWVAVDEVNELKHWREGNRIETDVITVETKQLAKEDDPARFGVTNHWLDGDGKPLLIEKTDVTIFPDGLIAYDIHLTPAGKEAVTFGDTKEGFFAIRLCDELRADKGTGIITDSKGRQGEPEIWGQQAHWVDYSGEVDGKEVGVALFDHPDNFRPGRYHARSYGLFAVSPFGREAYTKGKLEAKPVRLEPGETLRLRYAAWIHGDVDAEDVAARYQRYVEGSGD